MAMAHRGSVRLFGKMIQVTGGGEEEEDNLHAREDDGGGSASTAATSFGDKRQAQLNHVPTTESRIQATGHVQSNENPSKADTIPYKEETLTVKSSIQKEGEGEEEEENDTCESDSQEKTLLKKPDRILPCPRCNSQDTKFCYFNNYNVNKPRHFCRNCQRYWTAGGTMRNMAVGAGRRKNKSASSSCCRYQSITLSELESLQTIQSSFPELVPQTDGTVLSFESDRPSCESSAQAQNVADKNNAVNYSRNGDGDEHSSGSVVTGLNSDERGGGGTDLHRPSVQNCQPLMPCFSVPPWAYTWKNQANIPVSYYHVVPYWGYAMPNPENHHPRFSPQITGAPRTSGLNSQLGKHSRDENTSKQSDNTGELDDTTTKQGAQGRRCLSFPLKLAIDDDPDEAAKSSVWLAMDLKKHKADCINGGGLFKACQPKAMMKSHCLVQNHSEVYYHPNPAAWSRSVRFREGL